MLGAHWLPGPVLLSPSQLQVRESWGSPLSLCRNRIQSFLISVVRAEGRRVGGEELGPLRFQEGLCVPQGGARQSVPVESRLVFALPAAKTGR